MRPRGRVSPAYDIEPVFIGRFTLHMVVDYPYFFVPVAHEKQLVFSVSSCFTEVQLHPMVVIDTLAMS